MLYALAQRRARHVHGGVARADEVDAFAQMVAVRIAEVIDAEMHVSKRLSLDVQGVGLPCARAEEDRLVSVCKHVLNGDRPADGRVGPHLNILHRQMMVCKIIQHRFRQTELGNAVAQHTADFVLSFKDRHPISLARKHDGNRQACRTGADDGGAHALCRPGFLFVSARICAGNIAFNG